MRRDSEELAVYLTPEVGRGFDQLTLSSSDVERLERHVQPRPARLLMQIRSKATLVSSFANQHCGEGFTDKHREEIFPAIRTVTKLFFILH